MDNPIVYALTPLMKVSKMGRVLQKLWCMRQIALSAENEARKAALANLTEVYSDLSETEAEEYALLVESEAQEAKAMVSIFEERGIEKGIAIGLERGKEEAQQMVSVFEERGIEKGLAIGIEQGAVNASREHLLALLRHKFGALPQSAAAPLAALHSKAELDALFLRALDAGTLAELGLDTPV